jgi:hypothetical protein
MAMNERKRQQQEDEKIKKSLVDTVFEELLNDKSFIETCNFLRSHAIRLDEQY